MTTPRVSATMLSARRHVEGRRGMPGMMPREARGPGARREGEAHRASARAGARRARQGGRGAGRVPQVRRDAPRVRGARRGRVAGAVPRVLRPHPLAQDHGPARVPPSPRGTSGRAAPGARARAGRPGSARGPAGCARARPGSCARGPARPWAAPLRRPGGDGRLLPGRRHAPRRVAGRQAARVGGGVAPGPRRSARGRRPDGRPIESEQQVLEEVHLQNLLGAQTVLLGDGAHLAAQARIVTDPGHPHITSR